MALIQDEDSKDGGKVLVKGTCESTFKPTRKWTYNGIHMSSPKPETKEKSSCIEKYAQSEKNIASKRLCNGIHLPYSKAEMKEDSNKTDENSKYEDKESAKIDWNVI